MVQLGSPETLRVKNQVNPNQDPFLSYSQLSNIKMRRKMTRRKPPVSLEPVMIGSSLLSSEFSGDPRSRFIIVYITSFTKKKATPGKTKKKFGATVHYYHKCMSLLLAGEGPKGSPSP